MFLRTFSFLWFVDYIKPAPVSQQQSIFYFFLFSFFFFLVEKLL